MELWQQSGLLVSSTPAGTLLQLSPSSHGSSSEDTTPFTSCTTHYQEIFCKLSRIFSYHDPNRFAGQSRDLYVFSSRHLGASGEITRLSTCSWGQPPRFLTRPWWPSVVIQETSPWHSDSAEKRHYKWQIISKAKDTKRLDKWNGYCW